MIRVLFLILAVMSSIAVAQTEEKPKAVKYSEFETATNGYVKMIMDGFYVELGNNPQAQGYIINYGTYREIAVREKQIRNAIDFRKFDAGRITLVRGGFWKTTKSELWVVPPGAENPQPTEASLTSSDNNVIPQKIAKPVRFEKIGVHSEKFNLWIFGDYFGKLKSQVKGNGYILINADDAEYAKFEKKIREYVSLANLDPERIVFVKGKPENPMTTELWFVPKELKSPNFTRKAEKFDEFGKLSRADWKGRMKAVTEKVSAIKYDGSQLFIINYGTQKDITVAESLIEKYLFENCRDCFGYNNFKINFIRGKFTAKPRRVFWIVPDGAEPPKP